MKYVICLALFTSSAIAAVHSSAGQSACRDESEIGKTYQHHNDPTKYWLCEEFGVPAAEKTCPKEMAYMHYLKECIPWENWIWKPLENPPTLV